MTYKLEWNVGPDAEFVGAGDEVVADLRYVAGDHEAPLLRPGILVDVAEDGAATVNVGRGTWITVPFERVYHPDSAQARIAALELA